MRYSKLEFAPQKYGSENINYSVEWFFLLLIASLCEATSGLAKVESPVGQIEKLTTISYFNDRFFSYGKTKETYLDLFL